MELIICLQMDLTLDCLQRLIGHYTQPTTNQPTTDLFPADCHKNFNLNSYLLNLFNKLTLRLK